MRIISDWSDYYDCLQALGQDEDIVYHRESRTLKHKEWRDETGCTDDILPDRPTILLWKTYGYWFRPRFRIIGFCGKIYPYLNLEGQERTNERDERGMLIRRSHKVFAYLDPTEIVDTLRLVNRSLKGPHRGKNPEQLAKQYIREWTNFFDAHFGAELYTKIFQTYQVPLWSLVANGGLMLNPCLKDHRFYRVVDTATAFQEISMYIRGRLISPPPWMATVDDESMAIKKGHGGKYSFRTAPGEKKARRARRRSERKSK